MHLVRYGLHPPGNEAEFRANIDNMLEGRPFWSILPIELGEVPDKLARQVLVTCSDGVYRDKESSLASTKLRGCLLDALGQELTDEDCFKDGSFDFRAGTFLDDDKNDQDDVRIAHLDIKGKGYRGGGRTAIATYMDGTLGYEGPMMVNWRGQVPNPKDIKVENLRGLTIVALDGQEPVPAKAAAIILSTECSVHLEPPRNKGPRWFARQRASYADMYSRSTPFLEELYDKLVSLRA